MISTLHPVQYYVLPLAFLTVIIIIRLLPFKRKRKPKPKKTNYVRPIRRPYIIHHHHYVVRRP
jgi:hypothetical protein